MIYQPLREAQAWSVTSDGTAFTAERAGAPAITAEVKREGNTAYLCLGQGADAAEQLGPWLIAELLFAQHPELTQLRWENFRGGPATREEHFQNPALYLSAERGTVTPERWTETNGRAHPVRPPVTSGVKYRRYFPAIAKHISFRVAEVARDLDTFHEWHNQPRVYEFWELNKPKSELKEYLEKGLKDPHQTPYILEIDGAPVGYFELYWTPEDRLGPYYEYQPFDRGFHFLIGSRAHLGLVNTDAILKALCHFVFLDDPRTRRLMAEPRADNRKVLRYVEVFPVWKKLKEFDFPHKRAALIEGKREAFFQGNYL